LGLGCSLLEAGCLSVSIRLFGERGLQGGVERLAAALRNCACREKRAQGERKGESTHA
jgi:hypothetical protein